MTAPHSMNLHELVSAQFEQADPDALRSLLKTHLLSAHVRRGPSPLRSRIWRGQHRAHGLPQRLPPPRPGHPRRLDRAARAKAPPGQLLPRVAPGAPQAL